MLQPDDFKAAIQAIDALGASPAVLAKVTALANDPNSDIESLCALLRNDGALAADIIRISNSPYYSPDTPHSNLPSAISSIGFVEVIRVVNLSLSRQLLARDLSSYGISAYDYWRVSVATALVMEALANQTGLNREDAFTLGLLHALGRVLIDRVIDEKGFSLYWDTIEPIEQWERNAVGFDAAEAGALLLEHWHFPPETCAVIRNQLNPEAVIPPVSLLGALQFTRRLLALNGSDFDHPNWKLPESDLFAEATGLTHESVAQLISVCQDNFQSVLRSVDIAGKLPPPAP